MTNDASRATKVGPPTDRLRSRLAGLLNAGTLLALALGVVGLVWALALGAGVDPASLRTFVPPAQPVLSGASQSMRQGTIDARTLMLASSVVLLATPILRVLLALLLFARERDATYVAICLVVLVGLALGSLGLIG